MNKITEQKDACGNVLKVGDPVMWITPYYSDLTRGVVIKCNPKGVTVQRGVNKTVRSSSQVIKILSEDRLKVDVHIKWNEDTEDTCNTCGCYHYGTADVLMNGEHFYKCDPAALCCTAEEPFSDGVGVYHKIIECLGGTITEEYRSEYNHEDETKGD